MQIEIETDGIGTRTQIKINGEIQNNLKFFEFSINVNRSNKAKLIMQKIVNDQLLPLEFYGEGLKKFDEIEKIEQGDTNVIGRDSSK